MLSSMAHKDECSWGSRSLYLMVLLSLTIGTSIFTSAVTVAIVKGAAGHIIGYLLTFIFVGIPMMYMEFIVSQFTTRNCLEVWKARSCLSHIGYIQLAWQIFFVIYNHTVTAFVIHYFLISFEDPIPYYICGSWSTKNCNIAIHNYTVNQDCIKLKTASFSYCDSLHTTYPEIQYWVYFILGLDKTYYYVAWRVCLASAISCVIIYLSCFKRKSSIKWFIWFFILYPIIGYILLMIGSMMQKGLVQKFEEALDTNFEVFLNRCRISDIIQHVLYTLNIGTGVAFNLGASTSFRAPCYSNVVITVVVSAAFMVLTISTFAMISCPYAFEYNTKSSIVMSMQASQVFEKIPRMMKEFDNKALWLILVFSCDSILGASASSMIILSLLEMFAAKYSIVNKYTGLVTFAITIVLFLITIPFLGRNGVYGVFEFRRAVNPINIFMGMLESLVFVLWYGVDKFSEDVHFMQGIQPKTYMKLAWVASTGISAFVFIKDSYDTFSDSKSPFLAVGRYTFVAILVFIILITLIKLVVAACNKKFMEAIKLDPMWGPRSEVLLRSRAMFSAQAMTKEYMYRQYHLQAGILARQRTANVRRERGGTTISHI